MAEIVGPYGFVQTSMRPVDAHLSHLRHLANKVASKDVLASRFPLSKSEQGRRATSVSAHVAQAIDFFEHSLDARQTIRPVLQYYAYLNFAVAAILAYRPPNFERYRSHGVHDLSHRLTTFDLPSRIVKVGRGAVPLFNSIVSGESLEGQTLRLIQVLAAIPLLGYELQSRFKKVVQHIAVVEQVQPFENKWHSNVTFSDVS